MSSAVYRAICTDSRLNAMGIDGANVFSDYAAESVRRDGMTVILRWGNQAYRRETQAGPTVLTVWVHQPVELGTDFLEIDKAHFYIRETLTDLTQEVGEDYIRVTSVDFTGLGGAMEDPGFKTITKNAGYNVLLRQLW